MQDGGCHLAGPWVTPGIVKLRNLKTNNSRSPFPLPKPACGFSMLLNSQFADLNKKGRCQSGGGDEFRNRGATDGRDFQLVLHLSPCVNPDGHRVSSQRVLLSSLLIYPCSLSVFFLLIPLKSLAALCPWPRQLPVGLCFCLSA